MMYVKKLLGQYSKIQSLYLFIFLSVSILIAPPATASPLQDKIIVVDAGHGVINYQGKFINTGKKNTDGVMENKLTLEIAIKVGESLKKEGAKIYYTRTPRNYWRQAYTSAEDNKGRALFATEVGAEVLISIHCDWNSSRKMSGVTTLYEKENSRKLGEFVHRRLVNDLKANNRQLVHDTFTILDNTDTPAILVETGFLSNRAESKKLRNPQYQQKVAQAIVLGLKEYFKDMPQGTYLK